MKRESLYLSDSYLEVCTSFLKIVKSILKISSVTMINPIKDTMVDK